MNVNYLNNAQAHAICEDYQHLVGQLFSLHRESEGNVSAVIVAPYSRIIQWKFLRALFRDENPDVAALCPNGRYDVLLLPNLNASNGNKFHVKNIRTYVQEHDIVFNQNAYKALRIF